MDCLRVVYIYYTCSFFISERHDSADTCMLKLQIVHRKLQAFALPPWHFGTRLEQPLQRRQALYYPLLLQEHPRPRTLYCSLFLQTPEMSVTLLLFFSIFEKQTNSENISLHPIRQRQSNIFFSHPIVRGGGGGEKEGNRQAD